MTNLIFPRKRKCLLCRKEIIARNLREIYCHACLRQIGRTEIAVYAENAHEKENILKSMPSGNHGIITCRCGRVNCTRQH